LDVRLGIKRNCGAAAWRLGKVLALGWDDISTECVAVYFVFYSPGGVTCTITEYRGLYVVTSRHISDRLTIGTLDRLLRLVQCGLAVHCTKCGSVLTASVRVNVPRDVCGLVESWSCMQS